MSDVLDLTTFKAWARDQIAADDPLNESAINAATSQLGTWSGRTLTLVTGATTATARTYEPEHCTDVLWIEDAAEITSVVEDGTTLTAGTDYRPAPTGNRQRGSSNWRPYDRLYRLDSWWYRDGRRETITVTAKWGWTSFDPLIGEAVKVLAKDWALNRNTAFGNAGVTPEGFSVGMRRNPAVEAAIKAIAGPLSIGIA